MNRFPVHRLLPWLVVAWLAACDNYVPPVIEIGDPAEALAVQQRLNSMQVLNLTRVRVARLTLDGEPIEVTTLLPSVVAQAKSGETPADTVFRFSESHDTLVLFSRDPETGKGYRLDIPQQKWTPGRTVQFPVVNQDGTMTEREVEVVKVIER